MTGKVKIHGKEYKTVALRVQEFRAKHPDYTIQTELIEANDVLVIMKATILAGSIVIATGYAEEVRSASKINSTSALENAESSAVGRALAFFGLGGTEIASADEVANAIQQQNDSELIDYIHAIDEHFDFVASIKSAVVNEEWETLRCIIEETPNEVKQKFSRAYTNGGIFTTHEVKCMKQNPKGAN